MSNRGRKIKFSEFYDPEPWLSPDSDIELDNVVQGNFVFPSGEGQPRKRQPPQPDGIHEQVEEDMDIEDERNDNPEDNEEHSGQSTPQQDDHCRQEEEKEYEDEDDDDTDTDEEEGFPGRRPKLNYVQADENGHEDVVLSTPRGMAKTDLREYNTVLDDPVANPENNDVFPEDVLNSSSRGSAETDDKDDEDGGGDDGGGGDDDGGEPGRDPAEDETSIAGSIQVHDDGSGDDDGEAGRYPTDDDVHDVGGDDGGPEDDILEIGRIKI